MLGGATDTLRDVYSTPSVVLGDSETLDDRLSPADVDRCDGVERSEALVFLKLGDTSSFALANAPSQTPCATRYSIACRTAARLAP